MWPASASRATEPDGAGPRLYRLDVGGHEPQRVSFGLERYTSLAASADGRRLVATVAGPGSTFWRIPVSSTPVDASAARRISLTTGGGTFPRLGAGDLFYVSSRGDSDSIWKLRGETAVEVWSAPDARIIDGPAIARDGRRIAFSARRQGDTSLHVVNADGTNARIVTRALALHGAPAWAPDGQSVTVAAIVNGSPRLFGVPLEGGSPAPIMDAHASAPVWMPDGDVLVYSGPDVGTIFQVKAVAPHAGAAALRDVTLSRGSKYRAASSGSRSLFVLRGDLGHRNLWLIDLDTGAERQLTAFAADFHVVDFDVSPDGHELVLHQSQEHSDIVLIELAPR
jgi:Tol biopolymer transport system component